MDRERLVPPRAVVDLTDVRLALEAVSEVLGDLLSEPGDPADFARLEGLRAADQAVQRASVALCPDNLARPAPSGPASTDGRGGESAGTGVHTFVGEWALG